MNQYQDDVFELIVEVGILEYLYFKFIEGLQKWTIPLYVFTILNYTTSCSLFLQLQNKHLEGISIHMKESQGNSHPKPYSFGKWEMLCLLYWVKEHKEKYSNERGKLKWKAGNNSKLGRELGFFFYILLDLLLWL